MFVKRDNNKSKFNFSKLQAQKSTIQCKIRSIDDGNENLRFENSITVHDVESTRITFVNSNGLDICTDVHRLIELLDNNKPNNINIQLLAETNINWKNKRASNLLHKNIPQYWKRVVVTLSETNFN